MADERQTAIDVDTDKTASEPLTGGSPSKVAFTSADGKNEANVEFSGSQAVSSGLSKEEIMKYATDPTWVRDWDTNTRLMTLGLGPNSNRRVRAVLDRVGRHVRGLDLDHCDREALPAETG